MLVSYVYPRPEAVTKDVQPLNAEPPMLVSEAGKAISVRAEQPLNAKFPMLVSEAGKAISVRTEQP